MKSWKQLAIVLTGALFVAAWLLYDLIVPVFQQIVDGFNRLI